MRFLIFVLILFFANSVYAQDAFVYDDHGKRDPFVPLVSSAGMVVTYDEDLSVNDLVLEGIVADASGNNVAIVNGKIVKAQTNRALCCDVIAVDHVEFLKGTERFILKIKKGRDVMFKRASSLSLLMWLRLLCRWFGPLCRPTPVGATASGWPRPICLRKQGLSVWIFRMRISGMY